MPLDIQPLSPQRRTAMLLVLVVLLVVSVGFAKLLVIKYSPKVPQFLVAIWPPDGMVEPVRELESLPNVILTCGGNLEGSPRYFMAFSYPVDEIWTPQSAQGEALKLFESVLSTPSEEILDARDQNGFVIAPALLGRVEGYHVQAEIGGEGAAEGGRQPMFMMLRMAALPGRVVAICFSGAGRITDADRQVFAQVCSQRVLIRRANENSTRPS